MERKSRDWLKQFVEEARGLGKYDVGETIEGLARKLGKKTSEIVKLNSNENYFVPIDLLKETLNQVVEEIDPRIYPRDENVELQGTLSKYLGVSPAQITMGEGSDQLIDLVSHAFLRHGDLALSIMPSFSMYERCVRTQGARFVTIPLREDFSLDMDKVINSASSGSKLLFLCSPNNPTANQFKSEEIQQLLDEFGGVLTVDEAYAEFSGHSIIPLAEKNENLIVLRTFSKAFGLAGLRLGYAVSNANMGTILSERYQMPYSTALITLKVAMKLIDRIDLIKRAIEEVKVERNKLIENLNGIDGVHAFDSQTNFVLMQVDRSSDEVYRGLLDRGIVVRNLGNVLHLKNCLRVTVAPPHMAERFLAELRRVLRG